MKKDFIKNVFLVALLVASVCVFQSCLQMK